MHCLTKDIKVAFFKGSALTPLLPESSNNPGVRYFHIYEGDTPDDELVAGWIRQAAAMDGDH